MAVSSYLAWLARVFQIKQLLWFLGVFGCALTSSIVFAGPAKRQPAPRPENFPRSEIIEHDAFRLLNGPRPKFSVAPQSKNPAEQKNQNTGRLGRNLFQDQPSAMKSKMQCQDYKK
jgi:hypothetical protein